METKPTRVLRELLARPEPVVAPGVYDALTARLVEQAGFAALFVSGAGVSASVLGLPDLGLLTMGENLAQTRNITRAVTIPVIADCDTGYGNALNVRRTVQEFESAGVAGLFVEDQVWPKRCGHFEGKALIPAAEMAQKIRAAADARQDPDLVLIGRTDAVAVEGVDGALRRAALYGQSGADLIFVEAPPSVDDLARIARECPVPLMVNLVEGGKTPLLSVAELGTLGFKLITFSGSLQKVAIHAMEEALRTLAQTGSVADLYPARMVSLDRRGEILGLPAYLALDEHYAMPAETAS